MTSSWKCQCGVVNFATDLICKKCQAQRPQAADPITTPAVTKVREVNPVSKNQVFALNVLFCLGLLLLAWSIFKPKPKFEYKVLTLSTESNERTGAGALRYTSIKVDETQFASLGDEGWELVGSFLEMETAFPNFGKEEYVTGLQPNIRLQRAVLIFKRQR
jgi:hypothetical protein